jgi:hypothetical protein
MSFLVRLAYDGDGVPVSETDPINDVQYYDAERGYGDWEEIIPEHETSRIVSNEFRNIRHYMQGLSQAL